MEVHHACRGRLTVTAFSDLVDCQSTIDSGWTLVAAPLLTSAIDSALGVPPPDGSPAAISDQASAYQQASATCRQVTGQLNDVAKNKLPAAWRGDVAETASEAVTAVSEEVTATAAVLSKAGAALQSWAEDLAWAQSTDRSGRDSLKSAKSRLGPLGGWLSTFVELGNPEDFAIAVTEARDGIAAMVAAAGLLQNGSGETTAATLTALAGQARASRLHASGLDPLDAVVLATEQNAASDGGGSILTAAEMTRASQLLGRMSTAQQQQFEKLLDDAKSPAEAAYLMKALAAGNSLAAIEQFDKLIHPYGSNLAWLSQHLAPDLVNGTYDGKTVIPFTIKGLSGSLYYAPYSQGLVSDCVAASTVAALANLDPVYMLQLTTGNHPGVPGSDAPTAFIQRVQSAYHSNYDVSLAVDGEPTTITPGHPLPLDAGVYPNAVNVLANNLLRSPTGTAYQYVPLSSSSGNQAILPRVEQAAAAGQPVPIDVDGGPVGHQMVIIGASGDNLEIFDPGTGSVHLVSTQQFVFGQLGGAAPGENDPTAIGLELPSS